MATAVAAHGQTLNTLVSFNLTDGAIPSSSVIQGFDGALYGTTSESTGNTGLVFKVTTQGTLTTVHKFCTPSGCLDGSVPLTALVLAPSGLFYGTTSGGGGHGAGSAFKMTASGTLTSLHGFCSQTDCNDGAVPSTVTRGTDGNLYGTTQQGNWHCCRAAGTIFKITPSGVFTNLYSFCESRTCVDGAHPVAGVLQGTDGKFYGTTKFGGSTCLNQFCGGTIFRLNLGGKLTTLYSFCSQSNCADGNTPEAGLVQGSDGSFYGTTSSGGANQRGTVFKITPSGTLTTLYSFCAETNCADGAEPVAALVQGTDGNFYGTTSAGGASLNCPTSCGTIFSITPAGSLTTLYSFCQLSNCADGENPLAAVFQATDGNFYGTTQVGGTDSEGTVFSLSVGLPPFVETVPASGSAGATVIILGTDLAGTTAVTFNGTTAGFTVVSATEIKTTVPAGATTGSVEVTTPGGILQSNGMFRVR